MSTTVKTDDTANQSDLAAARHGLQLLSLIAQGINRLNLSKSKILTWTNNKQRLMQWLNQLSGEQSPLPVPSFVNTCLLMDTGYDKTHHSHVDNLAVAPWILAADGDPCEKPITEELLQSMRLPDVEDRLIEMRRRLKRSNVFCCDVINEDMQVWKVAVFRDAFRFHGQDESLLPLFVSRDVVWMFEEVVELLARTVHDPDDDPLGLQAIDDRVLFPVYTGSPFGEDGEIELDKLVKAITWLTLHPRSSKKHLGKQRWDLRVFTDLERSLWGKVCHGDIKLLQNTKILFRSDPSLSEKD